MTKNYTVEVAGDFKYTDEGKVLCTSEGGYSKATITCYNTSGNVSCTCIIDAK